MNCNLQHEIFLCHVFLDVSGPLITKCNINLLFFDNEQQYYVSPEPSAELLMNISRSRRLIMLLSHAYLEQDWCSNNFRSESDKSDAETNNTVHPALYIFYTTHQCGMITLHHMRSVLLSYSAAFTVCPVMTDWSYVCFQTGPSALVGVKSESHHHHVGGSVQTHEAWDQAAAQWAPALPNHTHLEAQLRGKIHTIRAKASWANYRIRYE